MLTKRRLMEGSSPIILQMVIAVIYAWLLQCTASVGCAPPANVAFAASEARGSVRDVRVVTLRNNTASEGCATFVETSFSMFRASELIQERSEAS